MERLEQHHPELITPDSPTQHVAGALRSGFATVRHAAPVRSLEATRDFAEAAPEAMNRA